VQPDLDRDDPDKNKGNQGVVHVRDQAESKDGYERYEEP
jgi:hypothetical protein